MIIHSLLLNIYVFFFRFWLLQKAAVNISLGYVVRTGIAQATCFNY